MIRIFIILSLITPSTFAWAQEANVEGVKKWVLNVRGGFLVSPMDRQIEDSWDHKALESPKISAGVFWRSNNISTFNFLFGPLATYSKSVDKIESGSANSKILTTSTLLQFAAILEFQPSSWRGFGLTAQAFYFLFGKSKTTFKTDSFERDLDKDRDNRRGLAFALTGFYEIDKTWKPFLSLDSGLSGISIGPIGGSGAQLEAITMGVDYAF